MKTLKKYQGRGLLQALRLGMAAMGAVAFLAAGCSHNQEVKTMPTPAVPMAQAPVTTRPNSGLTAQQQNAKMMAGLMAQASAHVSSEPAGAKH